VDHVVAADLIRAVREAVGMLVVGRRQQQPCRVRGAAGHDDDVAGVAPVDALRSHDGLRSVPAGGTARARFALRVEDR